MKNPIGMLAIAILLAIITGGCRHDDGPDRYTGIDSIPLLVMQVQQCSRLYTTEYRVHKIVTFDDQLRLKGSFLNYDIDWPVPLGDRKIVIPIDATLKGYIDFSSFTDKNVRRSGRQVTVILPDPKVTLTSSKVDQKNIREYVSLARAHFSDKELSRIEAEGREAIIAGTPQMGIVESARASAERLLVPLLVQMGFDEGDIRVVFRDDFIPDNLKDLFDHQTIERHDQ